MERMRLAMGVFYSDDVGWGWAVPALSIDGMWCFTQEEARRQGTEAIENHLAAGWKDAERYSEVVLFDVIPADE
jgi:hypothetical protein